MANLNRRKVPLDQKSRNDLMGGGANDTTVPSCYALLNKRQTCSFTAHAQ